MSNLTKRLDGPSDDDICVRAFETSFGMPTFISQDQQRRLYILFDEIVSAPVNQPVDGVHWLSGNGSKPQWSQADARFLGQEPGPASPANEGPTSDDEVLFFETTARGFVSDKERDRKMRSRNLDRAAPKLLKAIEAVLHFYGSNDKAFGDGATLNSCAAEFSKLHAICLAAFEEANKPRDL